MREVYSGKMKGLINDVYDSLGKLDEDDELRLNLTSIFKVNVCEHALLKLGLEKPQCEAALLNSGLDTLLTFLLESLKQLLPLVGH